MTSRPNLALLLTEPSRAALTWSSLPVASPLLRAAPRGDGHTVVVLPGFLAGDLSTRALRIFLRSKGYRAYGWGLGRNVGPTPEVLAGLRTLLKAKAGDGPVSLVGQSLGGIFARELARREPSLVRQVVTLGSPFALTDRGQSRVDRAFERQGRRNPYATTSSTDDLRQPIPVPSTAVYSRADGIVHWSSCVEPTSERHDNVEVRCGHLGMSVDPVTFWVVADRLAQPAGTWRPFAAPRFSRAAFPRTAVA